MLRMNSFGVLLSSVPCGRTSLQSVRYASILRRASSRLMNQFSFRHSSRNLSHGGRDAERHRAVYAAPVE